MERMGMETVVPWVPPLGTLVDARRGLKVLWRNMSGQVASTLGPTGQDSSQLDEPVVDQQPSVEQPQQEEPPAEIQDITPGKEEVNGEDPVNHDEEKEKDAPRDSDLETDLQELALAKTGGQGGDGPDVKEEIASNTETVEMPEEVKGNHLLERR
ncbi:X antigen family member 5-like isoform X1 [Cervus canadensis]|uniref:X antigen family member 5-like isoform X1 n=1 Tax=Cervus canadensis TaxID=1574408 RepID=UPI001CA3762B|nr:X antigen family member 5-like isoform X1 [Cervus canadensis]